jgi:hypothetical protein
MSRISLAVMVSAVSGLISLSALWADALPPDVLWVRTYRDTVTGIRTGGEVGSKVLLPRSGGFFVVGTSFSAWGPLTENLPDMYSLRTDPVGEVQW